jgi:hypothetical protein
MYLTNSEPSIGTNSTNMAYGRVAQLALILAAAAAVAELA